MVDTAGLVGTEPSEKAVLEFDEQHAVEMWEVHSLYMVVFQRPWSEKLQKWLVWKEQSMSQGREIRALEMQAVITGQLCRRAPGSSEECGFHCKGKWKLLKCFK